MNMTTAESNAINNHPVSSTDNVEFGRNTMCHFLSSFFRSLTRVTDVQQEKFFNSINQIVINTPSVFVTDADKQHTNEDIRTTNSYYFDVYIVSLLVWTLSSKKFTSIQENTIAVLANLYGELSLRWPALFRIFINELIDTLNDTIKYDVEFIEEEIHQPKRLHRFVIPEQINSSFSTNVTIERCVIEFNCSDDISSFQINLISVLKHLASTLSTLLDRQTISILSGTLCELIRTGDIHVKSTTFSFFSSFIEHRSLELLMNDLTPYVHFSISDILLTIMNFIHTEPKHSIQLEYDFSNFIKIICQNSSHAINFFLEHIGFIIPRLKDLLIHISIASKADMEFHMNNNRPLRFFGEIQTEIYLEQFSLLLEILFECGQRDIGTSSLLVIHAYEIVEHLLANIDECLLAKYLNHALGKVIIWLIQEKNRIGQQPFRVRRIRLLKSIWQHLKITLEKSTFNNEEDALQRVFNVYCLITSVCQAFIGCQIRQIKFEPNEENDFYISWLTIDEISSIYGYLINTLVYLINSTTVGLFSLAYEYILATIVATSIYISDQIDTRLREDILSILCLSWLSTLSDWYDFQPITDTCKITKQLAQTFQLKFNQNDRLISLKCLALFNSQFYPLLRLHIFSSCLNHNDINTQLIALQVLPLIQYNLQTRSFLTIFYTKYCLKDINQQIKPAVMEIWRMHRCLFDIENNTVQLKIHDHFDQTILNSFELICTLCSPSTNQSHIRTRSSTINSNSTTFSLSNILPIFHLFNETSIPCNYLSLIQFFQTFDSHPSFVRPLNDQDENFLQLKSLFNCYLNENNQERLCLISIMPYLFKTILISNKRQWENSINDNLDQFLFDTLTQLNNDAIRQTTNHHEDDYSRLIHLCGLIARRTCNEDIFVFVLFILINGLSTSFQHTSQIELMNIAKDEYLQNLNKFQLNEDKNLLTIYEKIDLTSIVQQHTDSLYRLISQSLLLNSEQPSDICLRHLHLLFSMMQQNGSSFNTYLKRILPDLLPWIVEERSLNASRVVQHIRTAVKMSKKKVIFDAFPAIYSHVWRHVRLENTNGDYSISRVYEVNEFIEQEAGADLAAVFRFGGPPIFSKLLLYISTHPEHVMKGLQMAVGILDGISLTMDKDYSNVVSKECVYKALQSKLLGILCDFETELLANNTPLHSKKRVLLSLTEVLKIMEPAQIVATRVKLLRSLRLALQCSSELSLIVFNLWQEFIRHLSTNLDVLSSMILQLIASLLPFHEINPNDFQELILLMLNNISNDQIALITDDLLLIPQLNQMEKIKIKLNKCKKQHTESNDNENKIKNDERSLLENKFQRLITLLNFDMLDIRLHSLNNLRNLLKTNHSYILQMCLSRDTVPPIITRLILTLLERSNDSNQNIRFIAIDCLGEIGAIDPGRIEFRKLYSKIATSTSLMNRLLSNSNSEINNDDLKRCYFNLYSQEFALELFAELTRAFLAADQVRQQDTISYAIQECLKFYKLNLSDDNEKIKIDQKLWNKLNQEQQDLFKPLRTSKYVLTDETNFKTNKSQDAILKQLTIKTYEQWLTQYVPYLIQHLPNNNYYHLFHSCLFAVRFNSSIGSFLLPYIILHLIGENLGQDVLDKEIKSLISYTNQYESNEINPSSDVLHQIAQIIFTLIDFLLLFSSLNTIDPNEQAKQLDQRKRQQKQSNQDPLNIQDGTWNNLGITRIRDYIRLLHTDLSLARIAFKYDHYTRAYRHFEMYSSIDQQINLSNHSEFLLKLFHRFNDQDSAYGLIAIRDMTPKQFDNSRTDIYEEILSYELTGQIDEAIVAYENVLEINELNQTNLHLYLGYLNNLLTQQQFQHTIDQSTGIIVQYPTWINMLNPLRIEAAWKLSKWNLLEKFCSYQQDNLSYEQIHETSNMNILYDLNVSKQFEEYVGKILCQVKKQNREQFYSELRLALNSLMGPISAASMEVGSYQRAYDYLAKLHLLKDLEYFVLKNIFHDDDPIIIIDNDDMWSQRHALLPPNSQFIEPSLALRRTLLLLNDNKEHTLEIGECWLHSARIARAQNNSLAAIGSLMKANQSHPIEVAIERAQWMWDKGEKDRAIMSLKQKKIELLDNRTINETVSTDLKGQLWLLLARYSEQNSPHEAVFEMYKSAQEAAPHWEETHFYLAQFYDTLLSSCIESDPTSLNSTSTTTTNNFLSSNGLSLENKLRMMEYIHLAVNTYCRSLKYGCEFIYQSLTRLLTMWLDFASDLVPFIKPIPTTTSRKQQQILTVAAANLPDAAQIKQHGQAKLSEITREVSSWTTRIPPYLFLAAFPYMVSRICHSEDMTSKALNVIITQVFAAFPQQTLWMMINLYGSSNSMRRDRCIAIWNEAANIESGLRDFIVEATILIKQLDSLCMHAVPYAQNKISLSAQFKSFKRSYATQSACPILIPIQSQMQVCLPPPPVRFSLSTTSAHVQQQMMNVDLPSDAAAKLTAMANKQGPLGRPTLRKNAQTTTTNKVPQKTYYDPRHQPFPDAVVTIHNFEDTIEVLQSLQKPKKILIRGSDGQLYPFLCKSQDDLRVDSRCLDFCHLFNKCLKKNSETRRRQLNIRTYAVYPINERCGLIEWLPNLCTFRSLVTKFYRQRSSNFSEVSNREIKVYGNSKDKTKEARYNDFLKLLAFHQPAVFHQYFFAAYPDPSRWYISRMNFVRSTAVMSMIGYIMGLGDRHCENILIDTCTGETVHVDFNCLFNKGLTFEIPEKVPFRLTHNIVDGMGTLGVEGVFRKTCEIILHLIRNERELLVSVLKTFIYDPLVEWKSATKEDVANMKKQQIEGGEVVNMKAQTHVRNILERVRGYCTDELTGKRVVLPLSVEGQVDHLIRQATSNELLCQMFIGWAAYL